jgi:hypothetical protein
MKKPLVCWRCGAAIKPDQRPITRLERCRACQADLHVCRQCRHYTTRLTGYCDHDHAEPPRERERANFCQYFTPQPGTHTARKGADARLARDSLDALFGVVTEDSEAAGQRPEANRVREELDRLFSSSSTEDGAETPND